jgi:SSS family solute:Na+ symporter
MILSVNHPELPWTVLIGGMWIPIFYYCGLNQFIVQRSLAAKSLRQGQLGVIFAAALWLLIPFAIVMPGVMAAQLYGDQLVRPDQAYPALIRELVPPGMRALIFAAIAAAVISSLASVLNASSTLFTMDIFNRYLRPHATEWTLVAVGRVTTVLFLVVACLVALSPVLQGGVFRFIQEFQGYVSPGILAAFAFGFVVKRAPAAAGVAALVASAPIYGLLQWQWGNTPYLHRMLVTFALLLIVMSALTALWPLAAPKELPIRHDIDMSTSPLVLVLGSLVILAVAAFFFVFR